jgi:predicted dehydrogenase
MTAPSLRIGLLGYGFGGRRFHAPLIASTPGCTLAGVVTRSPERRAELAADHPHVGAFDSLADLAAAGVDAVAISTPADTHAALAEEALRLGLPAVVDKPFTLDAPSARQTVEVAEQLGVPLSVYQNRRWDSDFLTVRSLVEDGALGRLLRFESRFERFAPDRGPPASGGGTLLDFGTHLVDQALQLLGPARCVHAEVLARSDLGGRSEDVLVVLAHERGVTSHLLGSWVQGAPGPRFRVTGVDGAYVVGGMDVQEERLAAGRSPATDGDAWGVEPQDRWGHVHRGAHREVVPTLRGRWDTYYPAFAAAVRGEGPVPVDPWDAVAALELLDEAARIAHTRHR